jgi:hypothetical protein
LPGAAIRLAPPLDLSLDRVQHLYTVQILYDVKR